MGSTRKSFTEEYKRNAVSLVLEEHRTVADVARGIGVCAQTLGRWVQNAKQEQPPAGELTKSEREELEALRQEVQQLRMEVEFSKKVAARFAKSQR
jgi:transposase